MPVFQVDLDFYHGPLDLLVVLVRQGEIDVLGLMIGEITHHYLDACETGEPMSIEEVGDFLVLASSLMEVKSRHLLPHVDASVQEIEADDAKEELVRQLMEYKRFREAAGMLAQRAIERQGRLPRQVDDLAGAGFDPGKQPIRELELWDLVSAFSRLMRENIVPVAEAIEKDPTPLPVYMNRLEAAVLAAGLDGISFRDLLGLSNTKPQIIGKFLATLELIKTKRVWVDFDITGEDILFFPPREEPLVFEESEAMAMADSNAPPDELGPIATMESEEDDENYESSAALFERLGRGNREENVEANPDAAWAGFEPLDDDSPADEFNDDEEVDP